MAARDIAITNLTLVPTVDSQAVTNFIVFEVRERVNLGEGRFQCLFTTPPVRPKVNSIPVSQFVEGSPLEIFFMTKDSLPPIGNRPGGPALPKWSSSTIIQVMY